MKLNILPLVIVVGAFVVLQSCAKTYPTPIACFTHDNVTLPGTEIYFDNCSQDADISIWDFGDGRSIVTRDIAHTYDSAGTYIVKLTTLSQDGKNEDVEFDTLIISNPVPFANGYYDAGQTCNPQPPYQIHVIHTGNDIIFENVMNFADLECTISGSTITIPYQSAQLGMSTIYFVGTGQITSPNTAVLNFDYTASGNTMSCTITLTP